MNQPAAPESRERWTYLALSVFLAVLWFATLSLRPLFNPDEGRYAEIAREMMAGGDWVIPHLNGLAYIEKPPLQYWATALSLRVFGQSEFAVRFYTACCALATLLTVWFLASRLWSVVAAWRAAVMLSSMMLFLVMGQLLTLDMGLTLYLTMALAGFLLAQTGQRPSELGWMLLAWVATALGVLSKGLVAAAIPAAVLVSYSAWARDFSPWRRLHIAWGLPLFLAITVPWHWLAALRLADFAQFFFVHEHWARYLTPSANREEAWWYFGVVLVLGSAPWTLSVLRVMVLGWQRRRDAPLREFNPALFLWIWAWFVCLFFSLSESKLIPYILPALPALALLIASLPADALRRDVLMTAVLTLIAAAALAMLCVFAPRFVAASDRSDYFLSLAKPLAQVAALLAASGLYVLSQRRREVTRSTVFLGVGWCLSGLLMMRAAAAVAPVYSGIKLAQALPAGAENAPIYSVGTYDQTLPFYWRRSVALVAYRGELDYGLRYDPGAELASVAEFLLRWNSETEAYAVMEKAMYQDLKKRGVPMREVG
ncbi:MAG TPA: phospholipid carrier-dependent glycosyltransferase, partial [Steroidobacteraceae bacterium]|nr:phospholipid carrier-dependent glycosyltransferase [Steroidobacteraceae bacterium]